MEKNVGMHETIEGVRNDSSCTKETCSMNGAHP
jgi:hypothetical protein